MDKDSLEIKPYDRNAKKHPKKQIEQIANSIKAFGCKQPLVIDSKGLIVVGHGRYIAMRDVLGWTETKNATFSKKGDTFIPYVLADDLSDDEVRAYRLADNKLNESGWDIELVQEELALLPVELQIKTGFSLDILDETKDDNFNLDEVGQNIHNVKKGDIYKLGRHRLMCGDCLTEDVDRLLDGETANMLLTDPPYGVSYSEKSNRFAKKRGGGSLYRDIANDDLDNYRVFFGNFLANLKGKFDNVFYVFMSGSELHNLRLAIEDNGYKWSDYLVWVKNNQVIGRKDYNAKHEFVVYGWQDTHRFYGGYPDTILEFDRPKKSGDHPTMKPIDLLECLIKDGSERSHSVIDVFGGSGSTLIACEQTDRHCFMMEIDPHFCSVIIDRWEKLTNLKAEKING